tara:strand:+ start:289379 stop:289699 length:321 start_codon:yes stop_codon:yes gene_type:complete
MEEKTVDRLLKFLYFILGVKIAVFGFIMSLLINMEFKKVNVILGVCIAGIIGSIFIILYFVLALIFKPNSLEISRVRQLVGYVGGMVGITLGMLFAWVLIYNGFDL